MARIAIIGGGAFGTAMACVVRRSGNEVTLWAREPEVVASIEAGEGNPLFLKGAALPEGIRATGEPARAIAGVDCVLIAVPAQHMRTVATWLRAAWRPGLPIVSCSKGVEGGSSALMPEVLAEALPDAVVAVLSGPSFASEIAADMPCGVALACEEWAVGEEVARQIANPRFCVHLSGDVVGTALAGAMKNVISIASGIAHARRVGENARATLITLGLAEAAQLALAKGGEAATFLGLAGAGDFMLTAHSLASRNTSLGVAIGEGRRARDVLAERREVTEGAHSVAAVAALARRLNVTMPITDALDALLNRDLPLDEAMALMIREMQPAYRAPAPAR